MPARSSATAAKKAASMAISRSRMVWLRTKSSCVVMFETRRPLWRWAMNWRRESARERVPGVGVNDESGKVHDIRGRFGVDFGEGDVEDRTAGLAQVAVRDVRSDGDNCVDGFIRTALKSVADGVPAGEESLDEGFV